MANKRIGITGVADFSGITREVKKLTDTMDNAFGKDGVTIFDKTSMDFLGLEAQTNVRRIGREMKNLKDEAAELQQKMDGLADTDSRRAKYAEERVQNLRKQADLERAMTQLTKGREGLESRKKGQIIEAEKVIDPRKNQLQPLRRQNVMGRTLGAEAIGTAGTIARSMPTGPLGTIAGAGAGGVAKGMGLGPLGMLGMGALGVVGAGAAFTGMQASQGYQSYKNILPQRLDLQARGEDMVSGQGREAAERLGFGPTQVVELQKTLSEAFGTRGEQETETRIENVLTASRGLGVDPQLVAQIGTQLRASGGTDFAQAQTGQLLSKAVTSGLDKAQATVFLSSAASLLSEINEGGVRDTTSLVNALSSLSAETGFTPELAARRIQGISQSISGSSGEDNAFFQTAAATAGFGENILGAQLAVRQGLTGIDTERLRGQVGFAPGASQLVEGLEATGLGDDDFTQRFAEGIISRIDAQGFDRSTKEGATAETGFLMDRFNLQNAEQAVQTRAVLEKLAERQDLNTQERKVFENLGRTPEERYQKDVISELKGIRTAQVDAAKAFSEIDLGESVRTAFDELTNTMTKLNKSLAKMFGSEEGQNLQESLSEGFNLEEFFEEFKMEISEAWNESMQNASESFTEGVENIFSIFSDAGEIVSGFFEKLKDPFSFFDDEGPETEKQKNLLKRDQEKRNRGKTLPMTEAEEQAAEQRKIDKARERDLRRSQRGRSKANQELGMFNPTEPQALQTPQAQNIQVQANVDNSDIVEILRMNLNLQQQLLNATKTGARAAARPNARRLA